MELLCKIHKGNNGEMVKHRDSILRVFGRDATVQKPMFRITIWHITDTDSLECICCYLLYFFNKETMKLSL